MIDSIRENRGDGKPFLAYLAFTAPHDPMHVPRTVAQQYRGRYDDDTRYLKRSAQRLHGGWVWFPIAPRHRDVTEW